MGKPVWKNFWDRTFYESGTVVVTGNTGIIATPFVVDGGPMIVPLVFGIMGEDMLTDETNDVVIVWYTEVTNTHAFALESTDFDQLTAANLKATEVWPGDVLSLYNVARDLTPLPPFMKITHTLAGTTKSMSYTIYLSYMVMDY